MNIVLCIYHAYKILSLPVILAYIFTHVDLHLNREMHIEYIKLHTLWVWLRILSAQHIFTCIGHSSFLFFIL